LFFQSSELINPAKNPQPETAADRSNEKSSHCRTAILEKFHGADALME
jgi:hypothetical protein